jgi:hypothetical protein
MGGGGGYGDGGDGAGIDGCGCLPGKPICGMCTWPTEVGIGEIGGNEMGGGRGRCKREAASRSPGDSKCNRWKAISGT